MLISKIDEILDFLAFDGGIHPLKEISATLHIPYNVCKDIASFLAKYDLVQLNDENLKINPKIRDLAVETSFQSILQITPSQ